MARTKFIAGLIGPTLCAIAAALLLNLNFIPEFLQQASREPILIFVTGILLWVAGLAILRSHNVWNRRWPVLVTVIGWLALAGGLARMLLPSQLAAVAGQLRVSSAGLIAGAIVLLVFGGFLTLKSLGRE
jgi:hypothetical protein